MSLTNSPIWFSSGAGGGSFYPTTIDQSLRFNDDSSAYLSWTPATAGSLTTGLDRDWETILDYLLKTYIVTSIEFLVLYHT